MKYRVKNIFTLSAIILSTLGFCSHAQAQNWDGATLFAYETNQDGTAEDDILLAMKALEEASAAISPTKPQTDDVDIDSILFAATITDSDTPAKQTASAPLPTNDTKPGSSKSPSSVASAFADSSNTPKHDVVTAPAKQNNLQNIAANQKNNVEPKHDVVTAPAKPANKTVTLAASSTAKPANSVSQTDKKNTVAVSNKNKTPDGNHDVPSVSPSALAMQYILAVYSINNVDLRKTVGGRTPTISELYQYAFKKKLVYQSARPAIGDLAFFHNTYDRNQDGRWNDWHTHVGIVESVDKNHTVSILVWQDNKIQRIYMNLKYPEIHKNKKGVLLNTQLRPDENGQRGTTSKLFGGFANLLGNASQITVIDNWVPGMKLPN
ncbi:MAG: CHAP domain-containing protein [Proteobacteria bacterium]|nr:CHAP domain-containing protein [Pseudomonadota bacterium]